MFEKVESRALTEAELNAVVAGGSYIGVAALKLLRPLPAARARLRRATGRADDVRFVPLVTR